MVSWGDWIERPFFAGTDARMIRLLTRYVLWDLLKVFSIALAGLSALIILVGVVQEATKQGLGLGPILRLIPYLIPESLRFAVPGTLLLAVSSVYGRMSAMNEVVALKSLGISPMVLVWPAVVVGTALSFACVLFNDLAVTWGRAGVQKVVVESAEQIARGMLQTQRSYSTEEMSMNVKGTEGPWLIKPTLTIQPDGDRPGITVTAQKAELRSDTEQGTLTIRFYDAVIDVGNRGGVTWPGVYEYTVSLSEFSRKGDRSDSPSNRPLSEIPEDIVWQTQHIEELKQKAAAEAALQLMTGDLGKLATASWRGVHNRLEDAYSRLHRLRGEPHRRWSSGFACLSFVMVGSAMAIYRRHGEYLTSFFLCFCPILLVFYPLLFTTLGRVKHGALPPVSLWAGNLVLLLWGVWMMRRVLRY